MSEVKGFKDIKVIKGFKVVKVVKVEEKKNNLKRKSIMPEKLIRHSGDYRKLLSYQKAEVIYEMTYYFCHNYLKRGDRTIDQMVQAARSGKQNIVEGCAASSTSAKTEIKLINVAKASLQELLEDYKDYLRTQGQRQWEEESKEWLAMRKLGREHNDAAFFMEICRTRPPETIANMAIILIYQADYLLYKQLERLEQDFAQKGGFSEKMARIRRDQRGF